MDLNEKKSGFFCKPEINTIQNREKLEKCIYLIDPKNGWWDFSATHLQRKGFFDREEFHVFLCFDWSLYRALLFDERQRLLFFNYINFGDIFSSLFSIFFNVLKKIYMGNGDLPTGFAESHRLGRLPSVWLWPLVIAVGPNRTVDLIVIILGFLHFLCIRILYDMGTHVFPLII